MPHFLVNYSEHGIREIVIEADSAEEAEEIVMDGDADYDAAEELDTEVVSVNEVREIEP
jgi:hypothetical protein